MDKFLIKGDLAWSGSDRTLICKKDSYILVENGVISGVYEQLPKERCAFYDYSGHLIIPGMCDLHLHAPQYQFAGLYMDEELLKWLEKHTFPLEAEYGNLEYAKEAYGIFVDDLKNSYTTRAVVFATIHKDSTLLLMDMLESSGLISYVGKVNMDRNSPDILREETNESIKETLDFIQKARRFFRTKPIITPRFIPSCSDGLMEVLGRIAYEYNIPVQSHLDENMGEVEWVKELCPWSSSYADAYDRFGMMGKVKTVMAHVVWPTEDEIGLLKRPDVFVAHSPSSNTNLASGIAPVRRFLEEGINCGLATDVAGGSSLSLFRMITDAIQVSKLRWRLVDEKYGMLNFEEAFYLATRSGGAFFGNVGAFEPGYDADILVLDESSARSVLRPRMDIRDRLEFYAYRLADKNPIAKFVKGEKII